MKVKDLIDKLGNFDPDMDIILKHPDACNNPYAVVCKEIRLFYDFDDDQVCLDGYDKHLIRMKNA